jgi:hypothetical protein
MKKLQPPGTEGQELKKNKPSNITKADSKHPKHSLYAAIRVPP